MKLAKAIENLQDLLHPEGDEVYPEVATAVKLGIEALKRIREARTPQSINPHLLLPGEDPEDAPTPTTKANRALQESPLGREPKA